MERTSQVPAMDRPSPTFSITGDGFVFESGQYVLQPYAVGIVDFEIPASDFGEALTADIFD